jgi:hypothetical protein
VQGSGPSAPANGPPPPPRFVIGTNDAAPEAASVPGVPTRLGMQFLPSLPGPKGVPILRPSPPVLRALKHPALVDPVALANAVNRVGDVAPIAGVDEEGYFVYEGEALHAARRMRRPRPQRAQR